MTTSLTMSSLQSKMGADLEEMVTCAICTFRLKEPKHLQCQHAFCTNCLVDWMASPSNQNSGYLPCPSCRHHTPLPPNGVSGLPVDFNKNALLEMLSLGEPVKLSLDSKPCTICRLHGAVETAVSFCSDCEEHLCGRCLGDHNSEPALKDHCVLLGLTDSLPSAGYICEMHNGKKLAFYCPLCLTLICSICLRTSHRGHGAQPMDEAVTEKKESLRDVVALIEETQHKFNRSCTSQERCQVDAMFEVLKKEIHEHALNAKTSVDEWVAQACRDLGKRKTFLHSKIDQKEEFIAMLASLKAHYEERLSDDDPRRLLADYDELLSRAGPLLSQEETAFTLPRWSFVPLTWPLRLGYLEKEGSTCSNNQDTIAHNKPELLNGIEEGPQKPRLRSRSEDVQMKPHREISVGTVNGKSPATNGSYCDLGKLCSSKVDYF